MASRTRTAETPVVMAEADTPRIETVRLAPSQIAANPRNPRRHSEDQLQRLQASLSRFGQTKPVLVRRENKMAVAGHGIVEAAKRLGLDKVEVVLWDVDQKTADAYMLADNRLSDLSDHDNDRVAELLREINEVDYMAVGFTENEVDQILGTMAADAIDVVEIASSDVDDRFWISVRGPLRLQAEALTKLKTLLADHPEIQVELGTVGLG